MLQFLSNFYEFLKSRTLKFQNSHKFYRKFYVFIIFIAKNLFFYRNFIFFCKKNTKKWDIGLNFSLFLRYRTPFLRFFDKISVFCREPRVSSKTVQKRQKTLKMIKNHQKRSKTAVSGPGNAKNGSKTGQKGREKREVMPDFTILRAQKRPSIFVFWGPREPRNRKKAT